jgi:hypothetical protein
MAIQNHEVEKFFSRYESRFNDALKGAEPNIDETVDSFASDFVEASPSGVIAGKNDSKFRDVIAQGWSFYKQIGISAMKISSVQVTILDDLHAMAQIRWNSSFLRKDKTSGEIAFDVFYILQKQGEQLRIFAYITGDEKQALKETGLIQ